MVKPVRDGITILPGTPLGAIVDSIEDLKKQSDKVLRVTVNTPLKYHRDGLSQLEAEQVKIVKNAIDEAGWSLVTFLFSTIYGCFLIGKGYNLGNVQSITYGRETKMYYSAGALQLANASLQYFNGYRWIARSVSGGNQTLAGLFEMALPLVANIYVANIDRTLTNRVAQNLRGQTAFSDTIFTLLQIMMHVGQFYIKFKKEYDERALRYLDSQMVIKNTQITQLVSHRGAVKDAFDSISNGLKRIVRNGFNTTADLAKNN